MITNRLSKVSVAAVSALLTLSACAPGPSGTSPTSSSTAPVSKDVAAAGPVTLTVWDQNTEGAITDAQEKLNAAFQKQ
jgi:raffinose/stachyose/melibiose transport system substrate-binding protein